jgi:hypothetical protein
MKGGGGSSFTPVQKVQVQVRQQASSRPAKPALFFLALGFALYWLALLWRPSPSLLALPSPSFGKPLDAPPCRMPGRATPGALVLVPD